MLFLVDFVVMRVYVADINSTLRQDTDIHKVANSWIRRVSAGLKGILYLSMYLYVMSRSLKLNCLEVQTHCNHIVSLVTVEPPNKGHTLGLLVL